MNVVKNIFAALICIAVFILGMQIISKSKVNQTYKTDYAELNHFKYGLFSVDAWKEQITVIISDEIDKLYLSRKNEKTLQSHLEVQLGILIDKIVERIEKKNSTSFKGSLKQSFIDSFVDVKDIKKGIPEYAAAMMAEMTNNKTESQIKKLLKDRIQTYVKKTFDTQDTSKKETIVIKNGAANEEEAKDILQETIQRNHDTIAELGMIVIGLCVLLFLMAAYPKGSLTTFMYATLALTLLMLLTVGVTTPMIDMEAKISKLNFVLFDHSIQFENQVLYFQSKSIMDVFRIMVFHKELQMKVVGVVMVCFSIVFPVLKMISTIFYYFEIGNLRKSKIIEFFVVKSSKWSMADVLVIAIFMAYIGFNGIINSQLQNLNSSAQGVDILTTNGTSLQPGFYLFFTYTILAMFFTGFLTSRISKKDLVP